IRGRADLSAVPRAGRWRSRAPALLSFPIANGPRPLMFIFIMAPPPRVGRRLRPARGRVFPGLLAAVWRQVEEGPGAAEGFGTAAGSEVSTEDAVTDAEEDAEPKGFTAVGGDAEITVEIAAGGREPRHRPAHPPLVRADAGEGRNRHEG